MDMSWSVIRFKVHTDWCSSLGMRPEVERSQTPPDQGCLQPDQVWTLLLRHCRISPIRGWSWSIWRYSARRSTSETGTIMLGLVRTLYLGYTTVLRACAPSSPQRRRYPPRWYTWDELSWPPGACSRGFQVSEFESFDPIWAGLRMRTLATLKSEILALVLGVRRTLLAERSRWIMVGECS